MYSISIYGSHDASFCFKPTKDTFRIYEFERLTKERNCKLNSAPHFKENLITVRDLIYREYGVKNHEKCYYGQLNQEQLDIIKEVFGISIFKEMSHHSAHASGALWQSPFDKCLIISSDSGGHEMDGTIQSFCIYHASKISNSIKKVAELPLDVCSPYTIMGMPVSEVHKKDAWSKFLTYAGKIMGLAAYGNIWHEWVEAMKTFYYKSSSPESLKLLGVEIGQDLSNINTITGQTSYDLAATSQYVFEELTINAIMPFIEKFQLPVILTGGGALNVLFNQKLKEKIPYPVFVPVNPNDSGLSLGFMTLEEPPETFDIVQTNSIYLNAGTTMVYAPQIDVRYAGFGILDIDKLTTYVSKYNAIKVSFKDLARLVCSGNIIGILRGNSECGPRALGNRSIICDPSIPSMKDKINKIKHREFYRPFAPVVKLEDIDKYFNFNGESPFMSYAPKVKDEYVLSIPSVVHEDTTARVQTVTREQNEFLYNLIDAVETISGIGVLLNTSFNIKGNPILTTIEDAIYVLENTELNYVLVEDYLFKKSD